MHRETDAVRRVAVILLSVATPSFAQAVRFVNPPNGATHVARFPVVSVAFSDPIPDDTAILGQAVRILSRTGEATTLVVRRSPRDDRVAIAAPAGAEHRLAPATDYVLEVSLQDGGPEEVFRSHFRTGGDKSVLCVARLFDGDPWGSTCDENYWRDDPATGLEPCERVHPLEDGSCACRVEEEIVLGGRRASCACTEEESFLAALPDDLAVVTGTEPAPGSRRTGELDAPIVITLDRDLGAVAASRYVVTVEDVTLGSAPPVFVAEAVPVHDGTELRVEGLPLVANRRYRVRLEVDGAEPPGTDPRIVGARPHRFDWTFQTWTGPSGRLLEAVPTARTRRVAFPTHLSPWPHLRFVFTGPMPVGTDDLAAPWFDVRRHDGAQVAGRVSWYDLDLNRLHLRIYEELDAGERYGVYCTPAFAEAIGDADCASEPLTRFLVQVPPPEGGIDDVRAGDWIALEPADEIWLAVRPHVLDRPFGAKERYSTDADGPFSFLGHVLLVPPEPDDIAGRITIDSNDPECRQLEVLSQATSGGGRYRAGPTACTDDADCPGGYECAPCPDPSDAGCPAGESRCLWTFDAFRAGLTSYCDALVTDGRPACELQDALRCAVGGHTDTSETGKGRMSAATEADCPASYRLHPTNNCVPAGRIAFEVADGEHPFGSIVSTRSGVYFDTDAGDFVDGGPPLVIQGLAGARRPTLVVTRPLPATGVPIPAEPCVTLGTPGSGYRCDRNAGVCDEESFLCVPAQQNAGRAQLAISAEAEGCAADADCFDGFRCSDRLGACVIDGRDAAFECVGGDPTHPELGGTCSAKWVQVDAEANVWRLWWPQRLSSLGSRRFEFVARIGPASGGTLGPLPMLSPTRPDYAPCDFDEDPGRCAVERCDAWNALDYRGQVGELVAQLADPIHPPPHAVWATGYHTLLGGVDSPDDGQGGPPAQSCELGAIASTSGTSSLDLDGPIGLYVKLPPGDTPADHRIQGSDLHRVARFIEPSDLVFRGLTFDGYPNQLLIEDADRLTVHGVQAIDTRGSRLVAAQGSTRTVLFSDNFLHGTGSVSQDSSSPHVVTTNNLFWQVQQKVHTSAYSGPIGTPTSCSDDAPECVRPACATDAECRIPFMDVDGAVDGSDATLAGVSPTCEQIEPASGVGRCSHGIVEQGLFVDNVLLDGEGPNNGPWYQFRMQRNHFENSTAQEVFDGGGGTAYVWILDNVSYNSATNINHYVFKQVAGGADSPNLVRGLSAEGNLVVKNAPAWYAQQQRAGKIVLHGASSAPISLRPKKNDVGLDAAGMRVVGNTLLERSGAYDLGASGGVTVWNSDAVVIADNTIVSDTETAINTLYDAAQENPMSGSIERNVALATTRGDFAENLCDTAALDDDVRVQSHLSGNTVELCDNASERPTSAAIRAECSHVHLDQRTDRAHLFTEPRPLSPIVDMETLQRHLVPEYVDQWDAYRRFPSYDPAFEDDVLRVRPAHPACGLGSGETTCDDPDPDDDLYLDVGDVCPDHPDPEQRDCDADGTGDVCAIATGLSPDCDGAGLPDTCEYTLVHTRSAIERGETATFEAAGAVPGERVVFLGSVTGEGCGPCPGVLGGRCVATLAPVLVLGTAVADATGRAVLTRLVPSDLAGDELTTQAVASRGPGGIDSARSNPRTEPIAD